MSPAYPGLKHPNKHSNGACLAPGHARADIISPFQHRPAQRGEVKLLWKDSAGAVIGSTVTRTTADD
jgi:hypothetical protein